MPFSAAYREASGLRRLWRLEGVELVTSDYAVEEARRNLDARGARERLGGLLRDVAVDRASLPPASVTAAWDLPAKDLPILAGALACAATHLITGDVRHFGPFMEEPFRGLRVMTPGAYLRERSGWT